MFIFSLVLMGSWHTPWEQIQQVRGELAYCDRKVGNNEYGVNAALAFFQDEGFNQELTITNSMDEDPRKAEVLTWLTDKTYEIL